MTDGMNHNGDTRASALAQLRHTNTMSDFFFEELKEYMGFDEAIEALLIESGPVVEPHFEAIASSFYDALNANRRARKVFEGPEQIARLKRTLEVWLREAFFGPWDADYFRRRVRIGHVHVRVGVLPHFMGGAMNLIRRDIVRVLLAEDLFGSDHVEAAECLFDLELTVMMQAYWDYMMKLKLELPLALATGLAHEIRNPLNAIALNLTLLERRLKSQGQSENSHIVDAARDEVRRITTLTTDLMDFAKPLELSPTWTRADRILGELEQIHRPQFAASGIELVTEVNGEPEIYIDPDRLRQALLNLLTNAHEAIASRPGREGGDTGHPGGERRGRARRQWRYCRGQFPPFPPARRGPLPGRTRRRSRRLAGRVGHLAFERPCPQHADRHQGGFPAYSPDLRLAAACQARWRRRSRRREQLALRSELTNDGAARIAPDRPLPFAWGGGQATAE